MTAEERARKVFEEAGDNFISSMDCPCPDADMVADAIREAEDAALEKAAKKMQALCEKNGGRHFCTGIAGEPCDFAAAIRKLKAQQLPKKEG